MKQSTKIRFPAQFSRIIFFFVLEIKKMCYLCIAFPEAIRAFSSAGLEHLPYKQRVGGSNPSTPTIKAEQISEKSLPLSKDSRRTGAFSSAGLEHLPYKQRVGGSNPSTPTIKAEQISEKSLPLSKDSRRTGAFSSAGLEHLPYKQRVGGSNPSTPTTHQKQHISLHL